MNIIKQLKKQIIDNEALIDYLKTEEKKEQADTYRLIERIDKDGYITINR